jgi:LPXTG-motif cell wall-anchored protein
MRQRLIAGLVAVAIGLVGAVAFASPSNASTTIGPCELPTVKVSQIQAENVMSDLHTGACLDITFTDKCDGTTVVKMMNGAFNDSILTVFGVKLAGQEYTLKGGSDPNTVTVVLGPKVSDVQPVVVVHFTLPNGTKITLEKDYKADNVPWTWKEPEGCVSPSPSPSASASPSPSPSVSTSTSAPKTTSAAPAPAGNDLPVTGSANTWLISGAVLLLLVAGAGFYLRRRRNGEPVA